MSITESLDLKEYEGKSVLLKVRDDDGEEVQLEGKVEAASQVGIAFKEKGKSGLDMFEANVILDVEALPEKPKLLKQKVLKPVPVESVRAHLADRHGINLNWLNSVTNEDAAKYHDSIDHSTGEAGPLGHKHEAQDEQSDELEQVLSED